MFATNPLGSQGAGHDDGYINGISCDVNNCYYNDNRLCTAEGIKVGPQYAASTSDTICATFRPQ